MVKRASSHEEHISRLNLAIHISNLTLAYDDKIIFLNSDLDIPAGALMAVVGPNNSGKSTLLKAILGMITPVSGYIFIYSRPIKSLITDVAYVPAISNVDWSFPSTTFDIAIMGCYNKLKFGVFHNKNDKMKACQSLEIMNLTGQRNTPISELSDSERQRALIARAITQDCRILIIDEPFSTNDTRADDTISNALKAECVKGKTVIVAHHDIMTLPRIFNHITFVNHKIIATGKIEHTLNEANLKRTYGKNAVFTNELLVMDK